jgi:hypothetical protein
VLRTARRIVGDLDLSRSLPKRGRLEGYADRAMLPRREDGATINFVLVKIQPIDSGDGYAADV